MPNMAAKSGIPSWHSRVLANCSHEALEVQQQAEGMTLTLSSLWNLQQRSHHGRVVIETNLENHFDLNIILAYFLHSSWSVRPGYSVL